MTNAMIDENGIPTIIGVLNSDGVTLKRITVNATNNALSADDDTTGSDNGPTHILRDENSKTILTALSSVDGTTLVPLYVDSNGKLLVKST